jgi:hypothetical protein
VDSVYRLNKIGWDMLRDFKQRRAHVLDINRP